MEPDWKAYLWTVAIAFYLSEEFTIDEHTCFGIINMLQIDPSTIPILLLKIGPVSWKNVSVQVYFKKRHFQTSSYERRYEGKGPKRRIPEFSWPVKSPHTATNTSQADKHREVSFVRGQILKVGFSVLLCGSLFAFARNPSQQRLIPVVVFACLCIPPSVGFTSWVCDVQNWDLALIGDKIRFVTALSHQAQVCHRPKPTINQNKFPRCNDGLLL